MANPKGKTPVDPNDDSVETGRLSNQSPRPVAKADVRPFESDPTEGIHQLDFCPVNSKIVVTEDGAYLATPAPAEGEKGAVTKIGWDVVGGVLPLATKIHKLAPDQYRGVLPPEYTGASAVYDNTNDVLKFLHNVVLGANA